MIEIYEDTIAPPIDYEKIESFTKMLQLDLPDFQFKKPYMDFLESSNGGKPKKYNFYINGESHPIDYFLNFASTNEDVDLDVKRLNVSVLWSSIEDRLSESQVPFAITPFGDVLCFDYDDNGNAKIVLWFHEKSEEYKPYTEFIANDFETFANSLH